MLVAWLQNICWHVIYVDVPVCEGLGCCKKKCVRSSIGLLLSHKLGNYNKTFCLFL